ncbi:MAG: hypothetical protein IPN36_17870 [Bacteroidetes bacterium]|nr:hypothetical protein [Bacteroidota bacterium]
MEHTVSVGELKAIVLEERIQYLNAATAAGSPRPQRFNEKIYPYLRAEAFAKSSHGYLEF